MNMGEKQKSATAQKEIGRGEELLNMIQKNHSLMEHIEQVYKFDQMRVGVLQHIFLELEQLEKEEIKSEIYQYGSMIKGDDLLARQLFLWLLGMVESNRL